MTATVPDGPDTELAELIRRIGDRHTEDRRMGADDPRCASCAEEAWPCVTAQLVESVGAVLARPAAGRDLTAQDVQREVQAVELAAAGEGGDRGVLLQRLADRLNRIARPAVARTDGQPPAVIWPGTPCGTCGHKRNHHAPSGGGCAACFGCDQFVPPETVAAPADDTAAASVPYAEHERVVLEEIDNRDRAEDMADRLAAAIAPAEVLGEHSSGNDPWQNALDYAERRAVAPADDTATPGPIETAARQLYAAIVAEHQRGETFPMRVSVCTNGLREALGETYPDYAPAAGQPVRDSQDGGA